jgi:alcohol dehydrogenase, propanol-preferring
MRAVRLHAAGDGLSLAQVPMPEPTGSQVRVRVAGCGVCHTDLHIVDGVQAHVELPRTLGHEVAGWIDAAGPGAGAELRRARLAEGDAVLVYGGWGCGSCRECRAGAEQRCERSVAPGFQVDGGYAEAMIVPHPRHLEPLRGLDPVHAAPLADAGATAQRAVARAGRWLTPGARVLVIGCGGVGGFVVQLLRLSAAGTELTLAVRELDPDRVERAVDLGADLGLLDGDARLLHDALGGPADVVIDVVGTEGTLQRAVEAVAPDGLIVLVGEAGGRLAFGFDATPLEAWLTTVAWGSRADLGAVTGLARAGRLRWRTEAVPLRDALTAHDRLRTGAVDGRLVLVPSA